MSKQMTVIEANIYLKEPCEFLNFTADYIQGPDEELCGEPSPYLLCYDGFDFLMWACEGHKNEQMRENE